MLTNPQTGTRYKDLKRVWTSAPRDAEIDDLTLHSLRHTFITRALDDGAPIIGVRDAVVGNNDINMPMLARKECAEQLRRKNVKL